MIRASRNVMLTGDYQVRTEGRLLGTIAAAPWRERARLLMGSSSAEIIREPRFGDFLLIRDRQTVARARPRGFWRQVTRIEFGDTTYTLRRTWLLSSSSLLQRGGETLGQIRHSSLATIDGEGLGELPAEMVMFTFGLVAFSQSRTVFVVFLGFLAWMLFDTAF